MNNNIVNLSLAVFTLITQIKLIGKVDNILLSILCCFILIVAIYQSFYYLKKLINEK